MRGREQRMIYVTWRQSWLLGDKERYT
jgi:hypothetical protein